VYDSGIGGLSVWREIVSLLPGENTIYVADQAHCPYGERSLQEIQRLSKGIVRFLLGQGAKLVVVACNTASAAALYALRQRFDVPIVGMEPAVKPAAERTISGKVGVMATTATYEGEPFARLMQRFSTSVQVVQRVCPWLVERVEAGQLDGPDTVAAVRACLQPLLDEGVDVLVLGCTHYPFLRPVIERVMGPGVEVIDPAPAVARQVRRVLVREDLLQVSAAGGQHVFFTAGGLQPFETMLGRVVGHRGEVRIARWNRVTLEVSACGAAPTSVASSDTEAHSPATGKGRSLR
jgi:glutamate racemase